MTRYAVDGWNPALRGATGNANFNVWADLDGSNNLLTRYFHGDQVDQLLGRQDSGTQYWYVTDYQGSVRDVLDNSGNVKDAITYDGWGNIISETNSAYRGNYAWTGRMLDVETGLQYNRARWYDPSTGRWQTQDPLGFDAGDSNLYRYVNNKFVNSSDRSGMLGSFVGTLGTGIATTVVGGPSAVLQNPNSASPPVVSLQSFAITEGGPDVVKAFGPLPVNLIASPLLDFTPIEGETIKVTAVVLVQNPNTTQDVTVSGRMLAKSPVKANLGNFSGFIVDAAFSGQVTVAPGTTAKLYLYLQDYVVRQGGIAGGTHTFEVQAAEGNVNWGNTDGLMLLDQAADWYIKANKIKN